MSIGKARFKAAALSFLLVAAFLFSSASAFADYRLYSSFQVDSLAVSPLDSLGTAFVTRAALGALGVEIAGSLTSLSPEDVARAMWYGGGSTLPPVFTYPLNLADYFSRETIKIRPDSVTIGGVQYSDVWLPHDCADKFRTNAFDFITRYNIVSESDGTFVSGVGTLDGAPAFQLSTGSIRTQTYISPGAGVYAIGNAQVINNSGSAFVFSNGVRNGWGPFIIQSYIETIGPGSAIIARVTLANGAGYSITNNAGNLFVSAPFDFTWVSGVVPADPLPTLDGLRLRVPASIVSALPQILDPDSPTYDSDVSSLISGLESAAADGTLLDPSFEAWDTPVPPASGTIADEPYSSLSGALSGISSFLNTISTSVSGIAESIISGDAGFFGNVVSALAAPFEPVFAIFRSGVGIWHYVVSWVGTISSPFSWSLSALGSAGSYFLSPIYAAAAAAVVLAVYKKFGR